MAKFPLVTEVRVEDIPEDDPDLPPEKADKIKWFRAYFIHRAAACLQEYVDEAENQDGFEYWSKFEKVEDALVDFGTYLSNGGAEEPDDMVYTKG